MPFHEVFAPPGSKASLSEMDRYIVAGGLSVLGVEKTKIFLYTKGYQGKRAKYFFSQYHEIKGYAAGILGVGIVTGQVSAARCRDIVKERHR